MDPNWLSAVGGVISAIVGAWALLFTVRIYAESRRPPVEWRRFNEKEENHYRLLNVTSGTSAFEVTVHEIDGGNAFVSHLGDRTSVIPGGWIPFSIDRTITDPYPTLVELTWREGPVHGKPRRKTYRTTLNL